MDSLKHDFWGAGEADCPREIKAGNGEIRKLRCKICGQDNPRDERCPQRAPPQAALSVLKDDDGLPGLLTALAHDCENTDGWEAAAPDLHEAAARITALTADNMRMKEALTPSAATKAAYIGEFSFTIDDVSGDVGAEVSRKVDVPWTTIKQIMAAILARTALGTGE